MATNISWTTYWQHGWAIGMCGIMAPVSLDYSHYTMVFNTGLAILWIERCASRRTRVLIERVLLGRSCNSERHGIADEVLCFGERNS
jgi:hypothetical protein